jgi:cytidylate kinase
MKKPLVIAIDGPSASGKGTLAKKLAAYFNLPYLNTGALYRLVAFRVLQQKIDPQNFDEFISGLVKNISEAISQGDLENEILFGEDVGSIASIIAKNPKLRAALFNFQRDFANSENGAVLDGRDTTTVIAVNADFKFFVTADVEIRAQRRFNQLQTNYEEILAQLKKRDENDLNRKDAPLTIAKDAIVIDNGKLSIEEGFMKILQIINS